MALTRKHLPNFQKLPYTFDIDKILATYENITTEDFNDLKRETHQSETYVNQREDLIEKFHLANNKYMQLGVTKFNEIGNVENEKDYDVLVDWAKGTYIEEVLSTFKGKTTRVRIARMLPGAIVEKHIDYDTNFSIRIHIPLITNDRCTLSAYRSNEVETKHFPADGSCWFVNQGIPHGIMNQGDTIRDHMIISIEGQEDLC